MLFSMPNMTTIQLIQQEITTLDSATLNEILDFVLFLKERRHTSEARPNEATKRTFEATDAGKDIIPCTNAEDMFRQLGI
ncbi:hypothetical protein U27_02801 [Candidatus Vecturithrix granuli]|uniref:DUF2281 domain-containing protein n=1 Tax=Vecturithrix granuli TaxID=1499967 RepID=A0A081BU35_VECG1|nr:hypothetical protein U27_02801 [Candidatus Vecturithrix granuli]